MKKTAGMIAKDALIKAGISQKKLADKMGLKSQQAVFNLLNAKNGMRVDNFVKIMNTLNYDVVIRDNLTGEEQIVTAKDCDVE